VSNGRFDTLSEARWLSGQHDSCPLIEYLGNLLPVCILIDLNWRWPLYSFRKQPVHLICLFLLLLRVFLKLFEMLLEVAKILTARLDLVENCVRHVVHLPDVVTHAKE